MYFRMRLDSFSKLTLFTILLFSNSFSLALECTPEEATASLDLTKNYQSRDQYMRQCVQIIGTRYVNSANDIQIKSDLKENFEFSEIISTIKEGIYSVDRVDYRIILQAKDLGIVVRNKCNEDPNFPRVLSSITGSMSETIGRWSSVCRALSSWHDIDPEKINLSSILGDTSVDANICRSGCEATAMHCLRACKDSIETSCAPGSAGQVFAEAWPHAEACLADSTSEACNFPGVSTPLDSLCINGERIDGIADDPDDPDAPTFSPASVAADSTGNDVNGDPASDATEQSPAALEDLAGQVAEDVFGNTPFEFERQSPSGSLDVPDVQMEGQQAISANFDRASSPGTVQAPQVRPRSALINMPMGSPAGPPGGTPKRGTRQGGTGGGGGGGGGVAGGGGGLGGGGGAKGKGRRGGVPINHRLKAIADGLGGNRFLSADGGKAKSNAGPPEIEKVSPRLRKKIAKNDEEANTRALNAALQSNIQKGRAGKEIFMKASYFPETTGFYFEMKESKDLLDETGEL